LLKLLIKMIKAKKIAALLTGRGGSTLKNKNILPVCGRPLLYYPAMAARGSGYITDFYVSSDDDKILKLAGGFGYKMIKRPARLARPASQHITAIIHALDFMAGKDHLSPDILVVLLANSVTTKTRWIDECIRMILKDDTISAVVPVNLDLDHHPFRAKKINKDGFLDTFFKFGESEVSTNRQDLEESYFLCHNFWVLNLGRSVYARPGQQPWRFMGEKIKPYIVEECFDVHDQEDIKTSENWVKNNFK